MRLVLYKQDEISLLESELNTIDDTEDRPLFLGARRRDKNEARKAKLKELDVALIEYDRLLEASERSTRQRHPDTIDLESLRTWYESGGFLAREEKKYLDHMNGLDNNIDLLTIDEGSEPGTGFLGRQMERLMDRVYMLLRKRPETNLTTDESFIFFNDQHIKVAARALIASFTIVILLIPVLILSVVKKPAIRFIIVFLAASAFVSAITIVRKAKTVEVFIAGATYAAVLVVFVAGNGSSS